jgi:PAS domain S-box-containing protein
MENSPRSGGSRLLLLVNNPSHADRLIKALCPDGYIFDTLLFDEVPSLLNHLPIPDLSILWFPYATPEALSAFEQLITTIRALNAATPIPVLLIIDKYGVDFVEPGFQLGISDILTRPIHPLVLRQRIKLLLQARQTEQAIARFQQSESSLRLEKERFRTVADFTFDWEYWLDPQRNLLYNSPSCQRITGRTAQEFIDYPELLLEIVHPDDQEKVKKHFLEIEALPQAAALDFRILTKDGVERWIGHACQPVFDRYQLPAGRRVSNRDITERKKAEQSVLRAERLAAMGRLTASLAHEINNPLQAMYSNIELISDFPLEDKEREQHLVIIRKETERLIGIVQSILDFARPQHAKPQRITVTSVLDQAIKLVQKKLSSTNINIYLNHHPDLPLLFMPPDQLQQVCLNLMINAAEHMPDGGNLTITTRFNEKEVEIIFQDTGEGVNPQDIEWIFEPFYTTKPEGTGLGLSVSQNIIRQYGGTIHVASPVDRGSTFVVKLPRLEEE